MLYIFDVWNILQQQTSFFLGGGGGYLYKGYEKQRGFTQVKV